MHRIQSTPTFATGEPRPSLRRNKTTVDFLTPASPALSSASPLITSAREDAFSLDGFFPVSPREQSFDWVCHRNPTCAYPTSVEEEEQGVPAGAIIRAEDKLGVLTVFENTTKTTLVDHAEERLYSPYTKDESCNEDSLHCAFMRRASRHRSGSESTDEEITPGGLFLPTVETATEGGWGMSALRSCAGVF